MNFKFIIFILFFCLFGQIYAQEKRVVNGTVTDINNIPIPGVNIILKGTSNGVTSDFDGNFSINMTPNGELQFSYIGYLTQTLVVNNQSIITVIMQEDTQALDEVVVIGYGTSSKKELVSAVASIDGEALENQPVSRVDQALQGRAAGVEVTSNNGAPGSGATIRIRGNSSINGNNNPLFVVDGFIVGTGFNLNNINVNDIDSIEILKDATALAIYGTRGASGVVIITTKNGKGLEPGKPTIALNVYTSVDELTNKIDIVGGSDYIRYVNEGSQFTPGPTVNVNGIPVSVGLTDTSLPLLYNDPDQVPTTDWIDLVSQVGIKQNIDLSVSGNAENVNYYSSINYFNQEGIIRGSGIEKIVFRNNLDYSVSDKLKTGFRLNIAGQRRENNKVNYAGVVQNVLPVRTVYDDDGNFTGTNPISGTLQRNPEADIQLRVDHDLVTNIIANTYIEYEFLKGLTFKSSVGASLNFYKNNEYYPGALPERLLNNNEGGYGRVRITNSKSILQENTLNFKQKFGKHNFNVLGGFTWQKDVSESSLASAEGFPFDVLEFNGLEIGSDPETYQVSSSYSQRTLASFLGRLTYSFDKKYVLTLVGRYDGSSVFEEGNKYSFFPSAGVAWNIDEENFMQDQNLINRLKIRGSFGIVGEQGVDAFNSLDRFSPTFTIFNENLSSAVVLGTPASSDLKWETTEQLDFGLEVGLLNNRISFEAGYYKKVTKDLLLSQDIPNTAGGSQLVNVGSVQNQGLEFLVNTVNIKTQNFQWSTTLTISGNRSKVLQLDDRDIINLQSTGNQGGSSASLIVGQPFPVFIGAEYLGTYQDAQEIIDDNRIGRSFLGSPRYTDLNGDGTINNLDYSVIGSPEADFYGGIRNTFTYKNLSLDTFFQGSYGNEVFNVRTQTSYYGRGEENLDSRVLNRWIQGVNEVSDIPRAGTSTSVFNPNSTVNVEDGSFLRLKTVSLSYDIPVNKTSLKNVFKSMNVYVTGNNLAIFTKFTLGDPEVNNFTAGSGFGSVSQGFASGQFPYSRSILAGLKVEF